MMSGKTPTQQSIRSFYGESPPKRSRLTETSTNHLRPAFKSLKECNSIKIDNQEPFELAKGCSELKLAEQLPKQHQPQQQLLEPANQDEPKDLDRDSPIPLRNLGNTCYENSIIQCLFSLNLFMDNFEQSMQAIQRLVDKPVSQESFDAVGAALLPLSKRVNRITSSTITKDDVRYRIANAFYNLYKCYTKKKIQIANDQANHVSSCQQARQNQSENGKTKSENVSNINKAQSDDAISMSSSAIPLCKPDSDNLSAALVKNECNQTSTENAFTSNNLTPVALVSSATTSTNGQSEIETRLEDLKSAVGERSSQFNSTHQQDASEFFYHVIDSIQEFYQSLDKTNDDDNPVTKAFELEFDYMIKCPKCHNKIMSEPEKIRTLPLALPHLNSEHDRPDEYNPEAIGVPTPPNSDLGLDSPKSNSSHDLRNDSDEKENQALVDEVVKIKEEGSSNNPMSIEKLDLPGKSEPDSQNEQKRYTLNDALNNYFKDDMLDYKCSQVGCDSKQRSKKCLIRKLPQILFITLARYSHTGKKNLDEIEAPFELSVPIQENKSPSHSDSVSNQFNDDDNEYRLVAVVCHLGSSLNAGHYTSYVYNQNNSSWYSCDDDSITKVQESEVKSEASKSGYCFFYAHKSCSSLDSKLAQHDIITVEVQHSDVNLASQAAVENDSMVESSAILTPESSPKSIPSPLPPDTTKVDIKMHDNHSRCVNLPEDSIDDWS